MRSKRAFDLVFSSVGLVLLSPILLVSMLAIILSWRRPPLSRCVRVGRGGKEFRIFKFRTTANRNDLRATRLGRFLRRTKIDELPQLINVVTGEMSLVGPRPEDPRFVATYTPSQQRILDVTPGLTSVATLAFRNEGTLVAGADWEAHYLSSMLPARVRMDLEYHWGRSLGRDVWVILATCRAMFIDLGRSITPHRYPPYWVIDIPVVLLAFSAAYYLRFLDTPHPYTAGSLRLVAAAALPVTLAFVLVNFVTRLDRRVWGYASAAEVGVIARNTLFTTALVLLLDIGFSPRSGRYLPVSVVLTGGFLAFSGLAIVRYRSRLIAGGWRRRQLAGQKPAWASKTLIFGAGEAGQLLAWRLLNLSEGTGYSIVGFVDDDPRKLGKSIHGLRVLGDRNDLPALTQTHAVDLIAVAMANIDGEDMRDVLTLAQQTEAKIKIVPDMFDWMSRIETAPLREIRVEDLLGRHPAAVNERACREVVAGKRVLVTGAAGSIGSALCQQIAAFEPSLLIALDSNESGVFDLVIELNAATPELNLKPVIADVTNVDRIRQVFGELQPDVIFHVAAYKHVPLMEEFPGEAARVNVVGTWTVLRAARDHACSRFVLVSTDKAVNPSSIMGATKRIAELLVSSDPAGDKARPLCTTVRFGNVLGSRGSVVPTFNRQIDMGGPVTVTDPTMTRFFMDVDEAASLIIQAAQLTTGQDIFMLEMGEQIRVDDLARKMIRMRGLRPGVDIAIKYIGVRPGEKLSEELSAIHEERSPTPNPSIYRLTHQERLTASQVTELLVRVNVAISDADRATLIRVIRTLVIEDGATVLSPSPATEPPSSTHAGAVPPWRPDPSLRRALTGNPTSLSPSDS
jgi:FlaA1/EpsC-like NDP-sugar epimerase/lipopolysaccharide/colanic/teichoic acid biosynthesis glycosyltransferase